MRGLRGVAALAAAGLLAFAAAGRAALPTSDDVPLPAGLENGPVGAASHPHFRAHTSLTRIATIGERMVYRGWVIVPQGTPVRFDPPAAGGEFTWGEVHAGRQLAGVREYDPSNPREVYDSVWVETTVQSFQTGRIAVPGLGLTVGGDRPARGRLPTAHAVVVSTVTPADSNADLRPVRGPYAAPWWERVPWTWVAAGVLAVAAVVWLVRRLRRRKPKPVAAVAPSAPRPRVTPSEEALRALAALRALQLPELGRFGEHALELTRITRRYLEATLVTPRPGDTSAELVERLRSGALGPDRLERLAALLSLWDRVKFARAPLTIAEARRAEDAVEAFVARPAAAAPVAPAPAPREVA